jgi:hypothetical protein
MRERLIEILSKPIFPKVGVDLSEVVADYLLDNGVIVPPCKVGDKTHLLLERVRGGYDILESKCVRIFENENGKWYSMYIDAVDIGNSLEFHEEDFGKTVFLSREEAEKALTERSD